MPSQLVGSLLRLGFVVSQDVPGAGLLAALHAGRYEGCDSQRYRIQQAGEGNGPWYPEVSLNIMQSTKQPLVNVQTCWTKESEFVHVDRVPRK